MTPSIPKTCKAVVIEAAGAPFAIKDVPVEAPKAGEVLIKVHACGICLSDVSLQQGHMAALGAAFPRIPGHEVIGTVVAVGPGEKRWKVGDRAGGPWIGGHDGTCFACKRGIYNACDNALVNGVTRDGGYAEYCTLVSDSVVQIPTDVDPAEYAPLLCAGVTVFNGIRKANVGPGDLVAIHGLGGLGHLAVQYSRKMGYRTVAISSSASKKDFATELGAHAYIDSSKEDPAEAIQKMGGAALVVITAPNPEVMTNMVKAAHTGGRIQILAPVGPVPVDTVAMITKGISVSGWPSGHALDCEDAIRFADDQGVKAMVEKFPLAKVGEAIEHLKSGKARFRAVLTMD